MTVSLRDDAVSTVPLWAKWLDGIALVCLAVSVGAALSPARVRIDFGLGSVSVETPWRSLLLALLIVGVRHWRVPRPHLGERVINWALGLRRPAFVLSARMLIATRLPILLTGYLATLTIGVSPTVTGRISHDPLRDLPARWDALWYTDIARTGYKYDPRLGANEQQNIVFFPAYPMMMRTLGAFTIPTRTELMGYDEYLEIQKVRLVWGGLLISLVAFFFAVVLVYRWAELRAGAETAAATVVLMSAYPFSVYFSAPYTEAVFLLLAAGASYAFERGRLTLAGAAGLLAGLTRPNGAMLSLAFAILALAPARRREPGWIPRTAGGLLAAAMPGIGVLLYSTFIYGLSGNPWAWMEAQTAWGRQSDLTAEHYRWVFRTLVNEGVLAYIRADPVEVVQTVTVAFSLVMVWPVWRRVGPAYAVFMLATLLPPLFRGGVLSLGRFTATLFPQFLALALYLPPERRTSWIIAFSIGQGLIAAVFYTWRPIY